MKNGTIGIKRISQSTAKAALAVVSLFFCIAAHAQDSAALGGGGATADQKSVSSSLVDKIEDNFTATYFGIYRGAGLNDAGNKFQPAVDGTLDPTSPQSMENYVNAGYKLDKNTVVGVSSHFFYTPIPSGIPSANNGNFEMLDPSLMISRANLIDWHGLKVKGIFYAELPLTQFDILTKHNMVTALSPTTVVSYDVPGTKLNVGLYSYVTAYIPSARSTGVYRSYKIYSAPNASYQLSKKLAATMWVDLIQTTRNTDAPFLAGMNNFTMDIEPGISWEFVHNFNFNPMLNIYPKTLTFAATSIQAVVSGRFF